MNDDEAANHPIEDDDTVVVNRFVCDEHEGTYEVVK